MSIPRRDELETALKEVLSELAEYDYIMGDIGIAVRPWQVLDGHYESLNSANEGDKWLIESSLLVALAVHWGVRDGAHSIADTEGRLMREMVARLRDCSTRTQEIARALDLVANGSADAGPASSAVLSRYVKGNKVSERGL